MSILQSVDNIIFNSSRPYSISLEDRESIISLPSVVTVSLLTLEGISGKPIQCKVLRFPQNLAIWLRRRSSKSVETSIRSRCFNVSSNGNVTLVDLILSRWSGYICTVCSGPAQAPSS